MVEKESLLMQCLERNKEALQEYKDMLDTCSDQIRFLQDELLSFNVSHSFTMSLEDFPLSEYIAPSLSWKRFDNGKYHLIFAWTNDRVEYNERPLIDTKLDVRICCQGYLSLFLDSLVKSLPKGL